MTLVMTLLARDEIDIVDAWLAFHLNAGADLVIATDNRSVDGTTEVLERYARSGHVHLIREPGEDLRQNEWVTRMARLAATEYGADWVINSDADEFWWPRGASLSEVLAAVPPRYGTVGAFLRVFCPRPGEEDFAERMTVRFSALAPINDPASLYKPIRKVMHRGHPEIELTRGNHALVDSPFAPLRGWFPIECFHFPLRSRRRSARTRRSSRARRSPSTSRVRRPPTTPTCSRRFAAAGSASTTRRSSSPTRSRARARGGAARRRHAPSRRAADDRGRWEARVSAPDARRGRGVRGRGGGARRGRRRPPPAAARRARASAADGRAAPSTACVPEALAAVPIYFIARRLLSEWWSVGVAALCLDDPLVDLYVARPHGERGVPCVVNRAARGRPRARARDRPARSWR